MTQNPVSASPKSEGFSLILASWPTLLANGSMIVGGAYQSTVSNTNSLLTGLSFIAVMGSVRFRSHRTIALASAGSCTAAFAMTVADTASQGAIAAGVLTLMSAFGVAATAQKVGLSIWRSVVGCLTGCALSASIAFTAAANAPQPPPAPVVTAPPATLSIQTQGKCPYTLSKPVESKDGSTQRTLTTAAGCDLGK